MELFQLKRWDSQIKDSTATVRGFMSCSLLHWTESLTHENFYEPSTLFPELFVKMLLYLEYSISISRMDTVLRVTIPSLSGSFGAIPCATARRARHLWSFACCMERVDLTPKIPTFQRSSKDWNTFAPFSTPKLQNHGHNRIKTHPYTHQINGIDMPSK